MNRIYILLLCLLLAISASAQQYYNFSKQSAAYTDLIAATVLTTTFDQSNYYFNIPVGYKMFGKGMPISITIGTNGYIVATGTANSFAFDPYLKNIVTRPSGSSLSAKVEVSGGDTIVKIEWRNVSIQGAPATDSLNFQVWLHKRSQTIAFHYGPGNCSATFDTVVINTSLLSKDFNTNFESHSVVGTPSLPVDDTNPNTGIFMVGMIPNGTVYAFNTTTTSVPKENTDMPVVYPNPVHDILYVSMPNGSSATYSLCDMTGKVVMSGNAHGDTELNVTDLRRGVYALRVGSGTVKCITIN